MYRIATLGAVHRHIRANSVNPVRAADSNSNTYQGDGTASLSDSYRALWHNMVKAGLPPQTTKLFQ